MCVILDAPSRKQRKYNDCKQYRMRQQIYTDAKPDFNKILKDAITNRPDNHGPEKLSIGFDAEYEDIDIKLSFHSMKCERGGG